MGVTRLILLVLGLAFTAGAYALPMGFKVHGNSVIDLNSGLEWLKVSETLGHSHMRIIYELGNYRDPTIYPGDESVEVLRSTGELLGWDTDDLGLYGKGWGYANYSQFLDMIEQWFGITLEANLDCLNTCYFSQGALNPLFSQFHAAFGHTNLTGDAAATRLTFGLLGYSSFCDESAVASISTDPTTRSHSIQYASKVMTGVEGCTSSPTMGSFLVRPWRGVPEPHPLLLLALALGLTALTDPLKVWRA